MRFSFKILYSQSTKELLFKSQGCEKTTVIILTRTTELLNSSSGYGPAKEHGFAATDLNDVLMTF